MYSATSAGSRALREQVSTVPRLEPTMYLLGMVASYLQILKIFEDTLDIPRYS